jgi:hypothetical protein
MVSSITVGLGTLSGSVDSSTLGSRSLMRLQPRRAVRKRAIHSVESRLLRDVLDMAVSW